MWQREIQLEQSIFKEVLELDEKERMKLNGEINRLNYIVEELRADNYKKFKRINVLKKENEQLRQTIEEMKSDERLYANEIVKLNKEAKEVLKND